MKKKNSNPLSKNYLSQRSSKKRFQAASRISYNISLLLSLGLGLLLSLNWNSVGFAQDINGYIREVRALELDEAGIRNPVGLAFSQKANAFHVLETYRPSQSLFGQTEINLITAVEHNKGSARISAVITDPINLAFDNFNNRLLIYQPNSVQLIVVDANADGGLIANSLTRFNASEFGLQDPQGMAVNPANGDLFILDSAIPQILHIEPAADGSFDGAAVHNKVLHNLNSYSLRGLAFDPVTSNFHTLTLAEGDLYEINDDGQVISSRDLSSFNIDNPQSMVFAPSADQTDDPAELHLYIADSGSVAVNEQTSGSLDSTTEELFVAANEQNTGEILELSFDQVQAVQSASFTGILVNTIDTWKFNPPSPDSAGIAFLNSSNSLLVSDSEVNEMPIYSGSNMFRMDLSGGLLDTFTTLSYSDEPTGVTVNQSNQHLFTSDDTGTRMVYELNPGLDGIYGNSDDIVTSLVTELFGSNDPEGVTFDSSLGILYIIDGINAEVYRVDPGSNGLFDGVDDQVTSFDTAQHGITDPEGITINPFSGNLYIVGKPDNTLAEITTTGELVQTIDISAANAKKPAGLVYAPSSQNPAEWDIYIAARGVDNGSDPNENDGEVYELTMPPTGPAPPIANDDNASTVSDTPVTIDVAANDSDGNGNLDPASANTACSPDCAEPTDGNLVNNGDGTFTYTPDAGFLGDDSFVYQICDTDSLCDTATVYISTGELTTSVDVRVSASSDDAEERINTNVSTTSSDLELVFDSSSNGDQVVGMRFNGVNIPPRASITNAYVQFQTDEVDSGQISLSIQGEDTDNAATFSTNKLDITSRPRTSAAVPWSPPPWNTVGEAGPDQQTPNIAPVIQEIVNRPGWSESNSLVIIISGTGVRTAESFDGVSGAAALLHVDHLLTGAPKVTIDIPLNGATYNDGNSIGFSGDAIDNEDGDLTANLSWESDIDGLIGTGGSFSRADLSVGLHTITATVTDSDDNMRSDSSEITVFANTNVLVGAGDIAGDQIEDDETARLLDTIAGVVYTIGDNVYPDGTAEEFDLYYDPTWGRHKARTFPTAGNHDYHTLGASGYFNYFGAAAGDPDKGYYSYDVSGWHIIALNSNCDEAGGCESTSPQGQWLQADLAANPTTCTLAYWHYPLFGSDSVGVDTTTQDFWNILYQAGAEIVLNGHNHFYERFAPQDPNGVADANGIREFIVGTGGAGFESVGPILPNSEVVNNNTNGVLKLTLHPTNYDWEFIPIPGQTFTDSGSGACISTSTNNPPLAIDDTGSVAEGGTLNESAPGVLGNDSDPDNDPLTVDTSPVTAPVNGSLTLNADGSYIYIHDGSETTSDSFVYGVSDGNGGADTATVAITISGVNDPPTAVNDSYSTDEDTALNEPSPGVLGNDSDPEGNPLTAVLVSGVSNGNLTLNADGSFDYTPNANFNGSDSFTYAANDGFENSNPATVTITVDAINDPPLATDDSYSIDEDNSLNVNPPGSVLVNDSDPENDGLTAVLNSGPSNGVLTLNINGTFDYTPNANFNGIDSFTYQATDGLANSNTATVTITVNPINDLPVAVDDTGSVAQGGTLNEAAPGVLVNDNDLDGDLLVVNTTPVTAPTNGSLTLNADGSYSYMHDGSETTSDSFVYEISDGNGGTDTATVAITISGVNDPPLASDDGHTTDEDTILNVAAPGVLGNDNDPEGDPLTSLLVSDVNNGSLTLNADGSFDYIPNANFNGSDSFTYQANDGLTNSNTATVTITVNAVNDLPIAVDDTGLVAQGGTLNEAVPGVLGNDSDVDNDPLTVNTTPVTAPANGSLTLNADGSYSYMHDGNETTSDSFVYEVSDGNGGTDTATVTITISGVNDPPTAVNDGFTTDEDMPMNVVVPGVLGNDSDPEGDQLTVGLESDVSNGNLILNADGSFDYTPNENFNGSDSFTYTANDGATNSNIATVTITVNPINDPPLGTDEGYNTLEDTLLNEAAPGVLGNDSDPEGDSLTAILVSNVSNGTLTLNADGSFEYTPDVNFNGSDSFTYTANDGTADSNITTVTINVDPVNDAPVAVDDADTTSQDISVTTAVITNDGDVDGNIDPTSVIVGDGLNGLLEPGNGTVSVDPATGEITYTPSPTFIGNDSYEYEVCDDGTPLPSQCDVGLVTISVTEAPISVTDIQPSTVQAGGTINVTIAGTSFTAGAVVTFENGNGPAPSAANIVVAADGESLTAIITAKSGGPPRDRIWDLRVTNPDGSSAVLVSGFTVTP